MVHQVSLVCARVCVCVCVCMCARQCVMVQIGQIAALMSGSASIYVHSFVRVDAHIHTRILLPRVDWRALFSNVVDLSMIVMVQGSSA